MTRGLQAVGGRAAGGNVAGSCRRECSRPARGGSGFPRPHAGPLAFIPRHRGRGVLNRERGSLLGADSCPERLGLRRLRVSRAPGSGGPSSPDDEVFMQHALQLAREAGRNREIPVGAVVVDEDGRVVGDGRNATEELLDPSAHAELVAIRAAARTLGSWQLLARCTLYVTLEPCPMCAGGILQSRLRRVVYGAKNPLLGADGSWASLLRAGESAAAGSADAGPRAPLRPHPFCPDLEVHAGVLEGECAEAMKEFFRERRKRAAWEPGADGRGK
ncbi:unnamed protein product [Pedinophyceae sp. YPF-701]|nr:unnamed protein product [Pedinophyceae sp. YPF-701]